MADIIVRIPREQLEHFRNDKLRAAEAFWRFSQKPNRLKEDEDFIWFTRPEGVVAGARVLGVVSRDYIDRMDTDDRGGKWNVVWDETSVLDPPVADVQYAGRSFRYLTPDEQSRLREAVSS